MASTITQLSAQVQVIGFSRRNRPIAMHWYVQPGHTPPCPLDTLFIGVFHGDEGISAQLLYRWINQMENFGLSHAGPIPDFGVIAVLNPDGQVMNQRGNAGGVDLNRNWPTANWEPNAPGDHYYAGPAPASEPETQALLKVLELTRPRKIVTVHSPYRLINYDGPARPLAEAMGQASGYPVTDDIGYATPGSFGTYMGKERHTPVITIELPDQTDLDDAVWRDNHPALTTALFFEI